MSALDEKAKEGEPVKRKTKAQDHEGVSIRSTIPKLATAIHNIEPGDELVFKIYGDHIRIEPEE